jgi:(2Fe-2S) ferredoxin
VHRAVRRFVFGSRLPDGVWYRNVTEAAVPAIVACHTGGDRGADVLVSFFYQDGRFVKNQ